MNSIAAFSQACRRWGVPPTPDLLHVCVTLQEVAHLRQTRSAHQASGFPFYTLRARYRASTARRGTGQEMDSRQTPLGLHRVARKIGAGWPTGTVFHGRVPMGFTWQGIPDAMITDRILWLEGLESGYNRGGRVDTFRRYIYIHGTGNEMTLGRPASQGCIHMAARDLIPLHDQLPIGTLVWISKF
ncbi:MAG: L,D-transpeptidase [Verrucomicrobiota bacterium]|nr:L,D-transpeptidase [Verrucomicrobiota bacterium]